MERRTNVLCLGPCLRVENLAVRFSWQNAQPQVLHRGDVSASFAVSRHEQVAIKTARALHYSLEQGARAGVDASVQVGAAYMRWDHRLEMCPLRSTLLLVFSLSGLVISLVSLVALVLRSILCARLCGSLAVRCLTNVVVVAEYSPPTVPDPAAAPHLQEDCSSGYFEFLAAKSKVSFDLF